MKHLVIVLLMGTFFLTACGGTPSATQPFDTAQGKPTSIPVVEQATSTPSPLPIATQTSIPSATPTASITPLPTIPTFTPTFDASTILTVTPAPQAECPEENLSLKPDIQVLFNQEGLFTLKDQALLDYLNNGGTPNTVINTFVREFKWFKSDMGIQQDITGDGISEFILTDSRVVFVFSCMHGKYQTLLSDTDEPAWLQSIRFNTSYDMNLNGIPEIITEEQGGHGYPSGRVSIFEWDGSSFPPLIQGEAYNTGQYFSFADMSFLPDITIHDMDENGTLELVLESNLPSPVPSGYAHLIPWRNETHIYYWNGEYFSKGQIKYEDAQYRFQAIQDAHQAGNNGKYQTALDLYRDAISKNRLLPWSTDIYENEISISFALSDNYPTPTPAPNDPSEYPRLAAYAYFRIMLLHLVQGNDNEATSTYITLQQTSGSDPYGRPYAEMATAFWEAYQSTRRIYHGCAAAIQYAAEHPEILTPLGSDYHGAQSHIYVPADVCPFR